MRVRASAVTASTSSVSSLTSTAPDWRRTERLVRQEVASAPVWDWANSATSFCPMTRATTGLTLVARRMASIMRGPSVTVSMCRAIAVADG